MPWRSGFHASFHASFHATVRKHVPNSQSSLAYRCDNVDQKLNQSFVLTLEKNHTETFGAVLFSRRVQFISCVVAQGHGRVMLLHPRHHSHLLTRCTFPNFLDAISVAGDPQLELFLLNSYCAVHFFNARECASEMLNDLSEGHDAATIKGLLYAVRSASAATMRARCDAGEKLTFPFLSAHATQYLPGTHGITGHRHAYRPFWKCLCARCHNRRTAANVLMDVNRLRQHCRQVHPNSAPDSKGCADMSVETHEYPKPKKPKLRCAVPQQRPAYVSPLCASHKTVILPTASVIISHLARNGIFADDPRAARVGGRCATVMYEAHWLESGRMRASDPDELRDFLRGHAAAQPTTVGDIECMWICRCETCAGNSVLNIMPNTLHDGSSPPTTTGQSLTGLISSAGGTFGPDSGPSLCMSHMPRATALQHDAPRDHRPAPPSAGPPRFPGRAPVGCLR